MSRAYLFQIFEEITESRILGEKEIVDFSYYSRVVLITPSSWFKLVPVVFVFLLVYYLRKHLSFLKSE